MSQYSPWEEADEPRTLNQQLISEGEKKTHKCNILLLFRVFLLAAHALRLPAPFLSLQVMPTSESQQADVKRPALFYISILRYLFRTISSLSAGTANAEF